jgi:hypothetical protein
VEGAKTEGGFAGALEHAVEMTVPLFHLRTGARLRLRRVPSYPPFDAHRVGRG